MNRFTITNFGKNSVSNYKIRFYGLTLAEINLSRTLEPILETLMQ